MDPVVIQASDYNHRQDLDEYIRNELGDNIDANRLAKHSIEGTAEELKKLSLSVSNRVYGVRVVLKNNS